VALHARSLPLTFVRVVKKLFRLPEAITGLSQLAVEVAGYWPTMELPAEQTQPLPRVTAEQTQPFPPVSAATGGNQQVIAGSGGTPSPTAVVGGGNCAACGAEMAPDQRYCVECGQRRGPTRPPFLQAGGQTQTGEAPPGPKRPRISPNTTLVAGIGTLMLAMGVGVLIGRTSSPASAKNVPVEYVTGAAGSTPTTTGGASTTPPSSGESEGSSSSSKSKSGAAGKSASSSTAAKVLKGSKVPPKAVVKPGTPGKGPGYQQGKFTGKFFGGSSSKKTEEEEELGEEGGKESSKGKK
jgi:hypothetical protein